MTLPEGEPFSFTVSPEEDGKRLDLVLLGRVPGLGRRPIGALFAADAVRVGRRPARKGERARAGDTISVLARGPAVSPDPGAPLDVRLETPDVVVVNKPAGQPTAPLVAGEAGTLASALVGRYPEIHGFGHRAREPGLIHRLDTFTSGLVVAARTEPVFVRLSALLSEGRLDKQYLAVVPSSGLVESGEIDEPLAPDPRNGRRIAVSAGGREAVTRFRRLEVHGAWALVEVRVSRAYRHQIRAHLAWAGHPLAGDALYGGADVPALRPRHALHASYVAWAGDVLLAGFRVESALPPDLAALLAP